jgi:hypothetical protein
VTSLSGVHPSEVIPGAIATLCAASEGTGGEFVLGALDALQWLAEGGPGPVAGHAAQQPVALRAVVHELAAAEAVIHGRQLNRREYAQGVAHALTCAQFATAAPPVAPKAKPPRHHRAHLREQAVG